MKRDADRVRLRRATEPDREFLWTLHRETMRLYVDQTWGWDEAWQEAEFGRRFDPAALRVVEVDGQPAGVLKVRRRRDHVLLATIEIGPAYQGRGLGSTLIRRVLRAADRQGLPVRLAVLRVNPARHLYERLGFTVVETTPTHHWMLRPT